jgi:uncharacterized protein YjbI with pentapeptide repeats
MNRIERLFTDQEKGLLRALSLKDACFDRVDFSGADLVHAVFDRVSLVGCDFRGARLTLGTFRGCDMRLACFDQATILRGGRFDDTCFLGAKGLSPSQRAYIMGSGGIFLRSV